MLPYILKRLVLVIPTLLGIVTINFFLVQMAPGGPMETMIARMTGEEVTAEQRALRQEDDGGSGGGGLSEDASPAEMFRGGGISPELIEELKKLYGFDKPIHERYLLMLKNFAMLDFGDSFFRDKSVIELIKEKLPVSISLGVWTTILVYLISIPLGIGKAVRHGSRFDVWSSFFVIMGSAIPVFLFAVLLIIFFAGGNYFAWFPLRGLVSDGFAGMSLWEKVLDYLWHMCLPVVSMLIGGFASLTMLTKNSFLDEINKQYVTTARAKGITEKRILYGHVFRNSMLIVISGFPAAFISMLFTGSLLIEVIFSLDGLGLMGFEAAMSRDYPVMFSTLYIFTLMGLVLGIISDITYTLVDPRISFKAAERG
ncbi:microcin C ABC transporter permease YejB [Geovibrio thiophilus]|uniref:Microcin C ABC transporter permease YejB n=1 Tax=Geovibrio thiophilus TaxID=139438 RepID=A0A3R6AYZ1_9BACT|nr:microcin C ABC transporter permease YejB [Geovibrio thiophilus]QAR33777.1 microcin C ABC transporter permease YejB [Geovibrio thiophilus]